jgi:hypothetical protein
VVLCLVAVMIAAYGRQRRGGGRRLTHWFSLGVLALFVPQDTVEDAVAAAGKQAKRSDGKLPPHVMVYLVIALASFADDDYRKSRPG